MSEVEQGVRRVSKSAGYGFRKHIKKKLKVRKNI
jgi:hypothetical protein